MKEQFDILIVDDEKIVIDSGKKILTAEGFRVDTVPDAEGAIAQLKNRDYKIIITDLMLPGLSGMEFIKIARNIYPQLVLVMITGYGTLDNELEAFKIGVFDFLPKPFSFEELLGVVTRAVKYSDTASLPEKNNFIGMPDDRMDITNYYFLGKHAWARKDGNNSLVIGPGQAFSRVIGEIEKINLPSVNEELVQGKNCAQMISTDQFMHTVWSPLSGRVTEFNRELEQNPGLIKSDPYTKGWIARILPTNIETELKNLFSLSMSGA